MVKYVSSEKYLVNILHTLKIYNARLGSIRERRHRENSSPQTGGTGEKRGLLTRNPCGTDSLGEPSAGPSPGIKPLQLKGAPPRSQNKEQRKPPMLLAGFEIRPEHSVLLSKDMASGRALPVCGREIPSPAPWAFLSTLSGERRVAGGGGLLKD